MELDESKWGQVGFGNNDLSSKSEMYDTFSYAVLLQNSYGMYSPSRPDHMTLPFKWKFFRKIFKICSQLIMYTYFLSYPSFMPSYLLSFSKVKNITMHVPTFVQQFSGYLMSVFVFFKHRMHHHDVLMDLDMIYNRWPGCLQKSYLKNIKRISFFASGFVWILMYTYLPWRFFYMTSNPVRKRMGNLYFYGWSDVENPFFTLFMFVILRLFFLRYDILSALTIFHCMVLVILRKVCQYFPVLLKDKKDYKESLFFLITITETINKYERFYRNQILVITVPVLTFTMVVYNGIVRSLGEYYNSFYVVVCAAWFLGCYVILLLTSGELNASFKDIRNFIIHIDPTEEGIFKHRLLLKMATLDAKLTIAKIIPIKRMSVISILLALFSYGVLVLSLEK